MKKVLIRTGAVLGGLLLYTVAVLYAVMLILTRGPSATLRNMFVMTVKETSAGGFLADMCLPQAEIDEILALKTSAAADEIQNTNTDVSLVKVERRPQAETAPDGTEVPDIEKIVVTGDTYRGYALIVHDPARVVLGVPGGYGENAVGMTLSGMLQKYNGCAGINGGGFYDDNGGGNGGIPSGFVIKDGVTMWDDGNYGSVAGFDRNHVLHVGNMTLEQALDAGIADACCFGPALIINGIPCNENGQLYGGCNPRTAIGQRADGAVILLIIEGRQLGSLGATPDDLIEIFQDFGAVNATNMDGGGSTLMYYENKALNNTASLYGERTIATGWVVLNR